jgi:hypothetical protein
MRRGSRTDLELIPIADWEQRWTLQIPMIFSKSRQYLWSRAATVRAMLAKAKDETICSPSNKLIIVQAFIYLSDMNPYLPKNIQPSYWLFSNRWPVGS